jgi:hypothetical protein
MGFGSLFSAVWRRGQLLLGILIGCFLSTLMLSSLIAPPVRPVPCFSSFATLSTNPNAARDSKHEHVEALRVNDSFSLAYSCLERYAPSSK